MESLLKTIDKLFDNAHFGKLITDVGPGLVLTIGALFILGSCSPYQLIPWESTRPLAKEYLKRTNDLVLRHTSVVCVADDGSGAALEVPGYCPGGEPDVDERCLDKLLSTAMLLRCVRDDLRGKWLADINTALKRRSARAEKELEYLEKRIAPSIDVPAFELEPLEKRRSALVGEIAATQTASADIEANQEPLAALKTSVGTTRSVLANIKALTERLTELVLFAVLAGVANAQVARYVFIRLIFDRRLATAEGIKRDRSKSLLVIGENERYKMLTEYYRYAESAVNFAVPILVLGVGVAAYFYEKGGMLVPVLLAGATAVLLILSGYSTYKSFRKKEFELIAVGDIDVKLKGV